MSAAPALSTRIARTPTKAKSAWLEERRGYLGATDISAILGVNPYASPHDVWLDKKGLKEDETSIPMIVGIAMEPIIAKLFQSKNKAKVLRSKTYRHPQYPFLACNPDREFVHKGIPAILECKNVGHWAARNFGQDGSDQVPPQYLMQVLWQLLITRKELVVLAALIDDRDLKTYYYTLNPDHSEWAHVFDPDRAKQVFNFAIHWWRRHIEGDEEPEMSGADSDTEWLKYERDSYENGKLTNTDERTDAYCVRLERAIQRQTRAEYATNELKNRIRFFMAERGASSLESSAGLFTWKTNVKGTAVFNTPFRSKKA